MNFRSRIAWLGRMPMKWRLLFGTQALITCFAIRMRLNNISRAEQIAKEEAEKASLEDNKNKSSIS